ncbi:hypothetical protein C0V97_01250 [Asaia sp. W19]|uniref:hypothetical protein n=1 Tax=unclassified Asaia TaxID=2685023 RepID=UPI000F8ED86C|nr:hypothetical protein [Asaia sp. W19]RUT27425.1 hypothetical protein C0V97_01250 [Asaia sp. W19]
MASISVGDVVACRQGFFLVIGVTIATTFVCPFVVSSELRHRADLDLSWSDLVQANLPYPNMRLRAVPCRRQRASFSRIGTVRSACVRRAMDKLNDEMGQSDRVNHAARPGQVPNETRKSRHARRHMDLR